MQRDELERLSKAELIELVLRLQRPAKTSRASSKPPSTDPKERREHAKPGGAKPGHEGHSRALSPEVDRVVDHAPQQCPCCRLALSPNLPSEAVGLHERIELPQIRPVIEHHRRLAVRCPGCGTRVAAAPPVTGTPFGPRLHAVATYLKTFQSLSYERLQTTLADLFGVAVVMSQGGLMNLLRRAQNRFQAGREQAVAALRRAEVVASDETGVRIEGGTGYHWVFRCEAAVVHRAAPTRAASVVHAMMGGHKPAVWLSDRYSAQQGHGLAQQTCLAHLARDVAYALEASDDPVPFRLKLWLQAAFELAADVTRLAASAPGRLGAWPPRRLAASAPGRLDPGRLDPGRQAAGAGPAAERDPGRAQRVRADAGAASQAAPSPRPAPDLRGPARPGRGHEQRLRARPPPRRDPAQGDQRLPGDVGGRGRGGHPHRGRHRSAQTGHERLQHHLADHSGVTATPRDGGG
jgi:transposase